MHPRNLSASGQCMILMAFSPLEVVSRNSVL
jgi:hypothetical protein